MNFAAEWEVELRTSEGSRFGRNEQSRFSGMSTCASADVETFIKLNYDEIRLEQERARLHQKI